MKELSVQKIFIYLACIFGILFLILTPPFQSPDEDSHFKKAYVMSEGHFFAQVEEGEKGFYLSEDIVDYISAQVEKMGNLDEKYSYADILSEDKGARVYSHQKFESFSTVSTNPVGHFIPMLGILMGKIVSVIAGREPSIVMLLYFARLFCMAFYIAVVAVAISITPVLKRTFCMVGLMPMALFISSCVSYDGLLIGASFIFTALCFKLIFDKEAKVNKCYIISFGVIAFVFFAIKIVYIPLFLLLIFIPREKYPERKLVKNLIMIGLIFLALVIIFKIPEVLLSSKAVSSDTGAGDQIRFILKNPFYYLQVLYSTIKEGRDFFVSSTIGVFGLVDTHLYAVIIYPYAALLFIVGILDISRENLSVKWYQRLSVLISVAAGVFGIFLAMYIFWTPIIEGFGVGADRINGVQGRYFIPLIPVVFLCFGNRFLCKKAIIRETAIKIVENSTLVSIMALIVSEFVILLRFWV